MLVEEITNGIVKVRKGDKLISVPQAEVQAWVTLTNFKNTAQIAELFTMFLPKDFVCEIKNTAREIPY
jgi:hypothetical protein